TAGVTRGEKDPSQLRDQRAELDLRQRTIGIGELQVRLRCESDVLAAPARRRGKALDTDVWCDLRLGQRQDRHVGELTGVDECNASVGERAGAQLGEKALVP